MKAYRLERSEMIQQLACYPAIIQFYHADSPVSSRRSAAIEPLAVRQTQTEPHFIHATIFGLEPIPLDERATFRSRNIGHANEYRQTRLGAGTEPIRLFWLSVSTNALPAPRTMSGTTTICHRSELVFTNVTPFLSLGAPQRPVLNLLATLDHPWINGKRC